MLWLAATLSVIAIASPIFADSKSETLRQPEPAGPVLSSELEARRALEKEYRAELEKRVAAEKSSMQASLTSLWMANAAVWAVLLGFVVYQALGVRKLAAELQRLKARHPGEGGA
ncbi:MAG: hypothetical protein KF754_15475 [Planctomycetes bacterium]|nr:hypothetical protein [Planctomycetota bacterium]